MISLYNIYDGREDMMQMITMAALFHFMGCRVDSQTKDGILCYRVSTGETFLLNPEFLPDMITTVEWVKRPNEMRCRLAVLHHCEAVSFDLRDLMFGNYLVCENYYQAWMLSHDWTKLSPMLDTLYHVPDGGKMVKTQFDYVSVAMWWTAVKDYFGQLFPPLLPPDGRGRGDHTRRAQGIYRRANPPVDQGRCHQGGIYTQQDHNAACAHGAQCSGTRERGTETYHAKKQVDHVRRYQILYQNDRDE